VIKAKLGVPCRFGFEPYIAYQYGIKNWQYQEFRVGVRYSIDVVK
jgi:hypothetical protein